MEFEGFSTKDFDVFEIAGLDERMEALKERIRPKFEQLGQHFTPILSVKTGQEMFYHVAKHARRTVNPPKDTWIAWSDNKRGYKMVPHFQVGLWPTHLFVWFAVIYEAPSKGVLGTKFAENVQEIKRMIPEDFVWSFDHMKPESYPNHLLSEEDLLHAFVNLTNKKKSEILCGITIDREDPILKSPSDLLEKIENTFHTVLPLYTMDIEI
ncbi:DUF1054 domain-containing protein [Ammoniphilus resinae]|uniref:UPF0637 protein J2Z37_000615 n=1 Tax=Ammoniphilus resinae TaxID=861532 RepID=A0ABS4GK37_9BACL|nr:DUF1054 domain-containing protein [Ammoniphilus resinae]MBP1930628.1 uncharacterized protein YktB (UPF0637 family) [Ammoniphilus resinae]